MTIESAPNDAAASPCPDSRYGAHPQAHSAVSVFADRVGELLDGGASDGIQDRVAEAFKALLATPDLLADEHRTTRDDWYRKHILYADPEKRFTLLALVWLPGQGTNVHGHRAWGAVGVYEGNPTVACYDCTECEDGRHEIAQTRELLTKPGDTCVVRAGLVDVHSIRNGTDTTVITLHAYGLDLVEDPDAINLNLSL